MDNTSQVGPGWAPLIRILDKRATELNITVNQVKEKFGGLRYYYTLPPDVDSHNPKSYERFDALVRAAETIAYESCEECGAPGTACDPGGWIKVLCPEHTKARKEQFEAHKAREAMRAAALKEKS